MSDKNVKLEFIRGGAAILVFICHLFLLNPNVRFSGYSAIANWGTESVIVFFILSGIVINMSLKNRPKSAMMFIKDRLVRIYPQFLISVIFSIFVWWFVIGIIPDAKTIVGNLLMLDTLQCHIVCQLPSNCALWSLSFEMVFYLIFSLTIFMKLDKRIWFIVSLLFMPLYYTSLNVAEKGYFISIISFSSIWLVGYFIFEFKEKLSVNEFLAFFSLSLLPMIARVQLSDQYYDPIKFLLMGLSISPFFIFCLNGSRENNRILVFCIIVIYLFFSGMTLFQNPTFPLIKLSYLFLPFLLQTVIIILKRVNTLTIERAFKKISLFIGKLSYSIYIIHFPLLFITSAFINNGILYVLTSIILVFTASWLLEFKFQPLINSWVKK